MSRVIVVGNGTSLLDRKNGKLIDSFDEVVRFNSYAIKGFEDHVGTATTIWFNVVKFSKPETEWRMQVPYKKIYVHSWQPVKERCDTFRLFQKHIPDGNIEKIDSQTIHELRKETGYNDPSTGLIAIWILIKQGYDITITGFDWWERTPHHYNDNNVRGSLHDPAQEKTIIDRWISEGKVKFLTEDSDAI